jgi:hypothetical protein
VESVEPGCGVEWIWVTTDYHGPLPLEAQIRKSRPGLEWAGTDSTKEASTV